MRAILTRLVAGWLAVLALATMPVLAQTFPPLTGRVVDAAKLLTPEQASALDAKLQAAEAASGHQVVVATIPSLEGYPIEDYGYRLGRQWALGDKKVNDGAILIVAPAERKTRIEVGYGLEPVLTDAFSSVIIQTQMLPRFRAGDYAGGIDAGTTAVLDQVKLPPEEAQKRLAAAASAQSRARSSGNNGIPLGSLLFWGFILFFVILPMFRRMRGGRRYRRGGLPPVILWGGGGGPWGGGGGGGGFGGFGGGGGGGFSGGGGSFGGGGASGGW